MENNCLFCKGFWPFLLLPLIVLLFAILFQWRAIEADVAGNAADVLAGDTYSQVSVNTHSRGREVLLSGTLMSAEDVDRAIGLAEGAQGVNSVVWEGSIAESAAVSAEVYAEPDDAGAQNSEISDTSETRFVMEVTERALILKGRVGATDYNPDVEQSLNQMFEPKWVINELEVGEASATNLDIPSLAEAMRELPAGSILTLDSEGLSLSGVVPTLGAKKKAGKLAAAAFDGEFTNALTVELDRLSDAELVAIDECQGMFNTLTATNTVAFESGSNVILPSSYDLLDKFTTLSRRCAEAQFEVGGHTDSSGSFDFNMNLSQLRAEAVVSYIVNSGVSKTRFVAKGYGPTLPIADNGTSEGRAKNRRVEFIITNQ